MVLNTACSKLVESNGQPPEASDSLIPSLWVFLIGTCYEFNREPGEITRYVNETHQSWRELITHEIITRLGIDMSADRVGSAKEDPCFRDIEPESFVLGYPTPKEVGVNAEVYGGIEIRFNWAFLDFWKSSYCNGTISWLTETPTSI